MFRFSDILVPHAFTRYVLVTLGRRWAPNMKKWAMFYLHRAHFRPSYIVQHRNKSSSVRAYAQPFVHQQQQQQRNSSSDIEPACSPITYRKRNGSTRYDVLVAAPVT